MRDSKKIVYNLCLGLANQLLMIVLGIVLPRLVLTSYGSEVNGLINTVTQIYSYIALLEAGIGISTVQALYKSVGGGSKDDTNAILAATNYYYKRTGCFYLLAIAIFSAVFPLVVDTSIPRRTVALIIIFNGLGSVIGFFFQSKYLLLLQAEGKHYVQTIMNMVINVLKNVAKIVLMANGADVVVVQTIGVGVGLLQMLWIYTYIRKRYRWIDLSVVPDYASIAQSKNVLVHQISGLIFSNTDTIVLAVACSLKTVSVYSLYALLIGMIGTALSTVTSSVQFSMGQTFHLDKVRYRKLFECYETYYMALVFGLYSITYVFLLPFLKLYTQGVTDVEYLDPKLPFLFIFYHLLSSGRSACNQTINVAGHFKLTQNRAIAESAINIVVSLLCVWRFGIYGVLMGTIAALLYRTNDMILYANRKILGRNPWITYRRWLLNLALFVAVTVAGKWLFSFVALDSYFRIIGWAVVCCIVVIPLFFGAVSLCEREVFRFARQLLRPYWGKLREKLRLRHV